MSKSATYMALHQKTTFKFRVPLPYQSASRHGKTCKWTEVFWQPADVPFW